MKNLPKIKGNIPQTITFALEHADLVINEVEAIKFNEMLVSVFNAGKNGVIDPDLVAKFEEFYKLYPRKKSPKLALKAYTTARKDVEHDVIMKGLREQLPELNYQFNIDETKVKHPSSWLNAGDWMNEVKGKPSVNSHIMSDEQMFNSIEGQYALKKDVGDPLRCFVARTGRLPKTAEMQAILDDPNSKGKYTLSLSKQLKNSYWKG